MKFKVGDKVKLNKNKKDFHYGRAGVSYEEIGTIKNVYMNKYTVDFPSHNFWDGMEKELVLVKYTYDDLRKSPIGTKITFANGEEMVKCSTKRYENGKRLRDEDDFVKMEDKVGTIGKIIKIEEPQYSTVYEAKQEILDETEKRYLRGVIRPFRDKVKRITKNASLVIKNKAYITIGIENSCETVFPYFDKDTMYKGMKDNKGYTLEELGL